MHVSHGFRHLVCLSLLLLLVQGTAWSQQPEQSAGAAGQSQLRWTPHRAATSTEPAAAAPTKQTAAAVTSAPATGTEPVKQSPQQPAATANVAMTAARPASPSLPPATVGLPEGVPAVAVAPRRQPTMQPSFAPPRTRPAGQMGDWQSDNRTPGRFRSSTPPAGQFSLPAMGEVNMFRTPQGESGRPVLAAEGSPRRPATARGPSPMGGGLAPKFDPNTARPGQAAMRPRSERLAMNADGLPSVMARAPQAAAIDDGAVPGRLPAGSGTPGQSLPTQVAPESIPAVEEPSIVINTTPSEMTDYGLDGFGGGEYGAEGYDPTMADAGGGMWMGEYPSQLHVESFYDDPFACEESPGFLTCCPHDGRICAWLRQFGRPYYGWRWYRDFTASAGITAFQNQTNFGLLGNYGTNEYINWAMPFWNAFGVGWQIGVRGVQSNFQQPTLNDSSGLQTPGRSRDQVFVTTGFFTRAFEGRGLQGGAVYDYLSDSYFENVDVSQIRGELSYVWGYHELGFWGAFNAMEQKGMFSPATGTPGVASTVDLYTAFYRLHFGDANEARVWGGASSNGQGVVGSTIRAPMSRSLAMEGTFTYLLPDKSQTVQLDPTTSVTFAPSAWNLSVNLVWYPAGRARRSLASPYRPLFDVADNGSMIRALARLPTP
ncbi:MAG: DUF6666 family protein [Planctomycetia bacterium]